MGRTLNAFDNLWNEVYCFVSFIGARRVKVEYRTLEQFELSNISIKYLCNLANVFSNTASDNCNPSITLVMSEINFHAALKSSYGTFVI